MNEVPPHLYKDPEYLPWWGWIIAFTFITSLGYIVVNEYFETPPTQRTQPTFEIQDPDLKPAPQLREWECEGPCKG